MSTPNFEHTGTGSLETMAHAMNNYRSLVDAVVSALRAGNEPIVELGAGVGTFPLEIRLRGIDPICIALAEAQRNVLAQRGLRAAPSLASFPDASIRRVYTLNLLEHIDNDISSLRELRRKMRKGSQLLIYVRGFQILYSLMDRLVGHVRQYRVPKLRTTVQSAGFVVHDLRYVNCIGFGTALLYRRGDKSHENINHSALKTYDRLGFPLRRVFYRIGVSRFFGENVMPHAMVP